MKDNHDNHPLDLSYLVEMVGHNPTFMIEFFDTFIEQTPICMAELEEAVVSRDWSKVSDGAHKIKPTFSYIGRYDVKEFVNSIELNARSQDRLDQIPEDMERLKEMLDGVYTQLEKAKAQLQLKS